MPTFDPNIYLGNPNLPSAKAQFDYTPEMIREIDKCTKDMAHFAEHHFFITTLDTGKQKIKLFRPQRRVLKSLSKFNRVVCLSSRQSGKTTLMSIYALHLTLFHDDKTVLIVANKEATAIEILRRIRMAYEMMPNWLKPGVKEWGKTAVVFANDSRIIISSTSSSSSRGQTANCVDGRSIVTLRDKNTMEEFDISMEDLANILKTDGTILALNILDDEM
jgi:hypothetical protein